MKQSIYFTERLANWNMLHIILGILKAVGIIVGILLLIFLALLLGVVFVPVRYRIQAVKQEERAEMKIGLSWLLHLVSVRIFLGIGGEKSFSVRICGIRLRPGKKKRKKRAGRKEAEPKTEIPLIQENEEAAEAPGQGYTENPGEEWKEEPGREPENELAGSFAEGPENEPDESFAEGPENESGESFAERHENEFGESFTEGTGTESGSVKQKQTIFKRAAAVLEKIRFQFTRLCGKIKQIIGTLRTIWKRLLRIPQDIRAAMNRIRAVWGRFDQFLAFWEEYEVKECMGAASGYLLRLIRHCRPRRIRGYLHFGFEDPSLTGQMTGAVYLFLPVSARQFEVQPDFHQAVFETEVICSGHIRACHFIAAVFCGFRDKKLRRLVRRFISR